MNIKWDHVTELSNFAPLADRNISQFERYLRFIHAAYNLKGYVKNNYYPAGVDISFPSQLHIRHERKLYYPQQGKPAVLILDTIRSPVNIMLQREFQRDPLYEKFKTALIDPISGVEVDYESRGGDEHIEFNRLSGMFNSGRDDSMWESKLPKLLFNK